MQGTHGYSIADKFNWDSNQRLRIEELLSWGLRPSTFHIFQSLFDPAFTRVSVQLNIFKYSGPQWLQNLYLALTCSAKDEEQNLFRTRNSICKASILPLVIYLFILHTQITVQFTTTCAGEHNIIIIFFDTEHGRFTYSLYWWATG